MKIHILLISLILTANLFTADNKSNPTYQQQIEEVKKDGEERFYSGRPYEIQLKLIKQLTAEAEMLKKIGKQEAVVRSLLASYSKFSTKNQSS